MRRSASQEGFSLIEVLVAIALFSVIAVTFYTALFSGVDGSDTTRAVARISEEARLGFNRMVRDTREAGNLVSVSIDGDEYRIQTDFDGDSKFESPNENGDYEDVTFSLRGSQIILSTPTLPSGEVLMTGVEPVAGRDIFSFHSNLLEYDSDLDGVTTCMELDAAPSPVVGNDSGSCDSAELPYLTSVSYALVVREGDRSTSFFTQAELRNKR